MRASASAIRQCGELKARRVASIVHGTGQGGFEVSECAKATALGAALGAYRFTHLKTEDKQASSVERFEIVELSENKLTDIRRGLDKAQIIAEAVTMARDLSNQPSNVVTPSYLASAAEQIAHENGMECRVLDRKQIEDAGMGLLAAVARGSSVEPRFIEIKYTSPDADRTIALIGKGITFDTGGYNLKPTQSMYGMKDDMSGAASVLAVTRAIGAIKPPVNIVTLIPATENSIGASAVHPGDVFTSASGRTVEISNTDAEGRLLLADAIAYANKLGVDQIIDAATLTGACLIALGHMLCGIWGNQEQLVRRLVSAGESCGEIIWPMPLAEEYDEELRSDVADIKNCAGKEGAAIIAAQFLKRFVGDTPWAHIDMSGATLEKDAELAPRGSTGAAVSTLIEYLLSL